MFPKLRREVGKGEQFVLVRGQLTDGLAVFEPIRRHKHIKRGYGLGPCNSSHLYRSLFPVTIQVLLGSTFPVRCVSFDTVCCVP